MLIGAVAGFCHVSLDVKENTQTNAMNQACKEIHTATLGMKLTSVVCK